MYVLTNLPDVIGHSQFPLRHVHLLLQEFLHLLQVGVADLGKSCGKKLSHQNIFHIFFRKKK